MGLSVAKEHWLPAEPFKEWLDHIEQREVTRMDLEPEVVTGSKQYSHDGYGSYTANTLLAQAVGLNPDHHERVLNRRVRTVWEQVEGPHGLGEWVEREVVAFSLVDQLVTNEGTYSLHDIYSPEELDNVRFISTAKDQRRCKLCGIELRKKGRICGFCQEEHARTKGIAA